MDPDERDNLRLRAKNITNAQMKLYIDGRLGLILDGTGKDYNKISTIKKQLDTLGYDSYMIFVNTSLEVALDRNENEHVNYRLISSKRVGMTYNQTWANSRVYLAQAI